MVVEVVALETTLTSGLKVGLCEVCELGTAFTLPGATVETPVRGLATGDGEPGARVGAPETGIVTGD